MFKLSFYFENQQLVERNYLVSLVNLKGIVTNIVLAFTYAVYRVTFQ